MNKFYKTKQDYKEGNNSTISATSKLRIDCNISFLCRILILIVKAAVLFGCTVNYAMCVSRKCEKIISNAVFHCHQTLSFCL